MALTLALVNALHCPLFDAAHLCCEAIPGVRRETPRVQHVDWHWIREGQHMPH